jgi:hypothetical protein
VEWKTVQHGAYYGRYLSSGHLVWVSHRTLNGARFDSVRLEMKGAPMPLIEAEVAVNAGSRFESGRAHH